MDTLGAGAVTDFARRCGVTSELPRTLSLALGTGEVSPLELTNAYATLAALGFEAEPLVVLRVRDRAGKVLEEHRPRRPAEGAGSAVLAAAQEPPPAPDSLTVTTAAPSAGAPRAVAGAGGVEPEVAYVVTTMLQAVIDHGTATAARALGRPLAGKTGTAQEHRDAWFVGYSPELVAGVWVGFDSHEPMGVHETGAGAALPAWISFMRQALARRPASDFRIPPAVELARVDPSTGLLAIDASPDTVTAAFVPGTVPARSELDLPPPEPQSFFMD